MRLKLGTDYDETGGQIDLEHDRIAIAAGGFNHGVAATCKPLVLQGSKPGCDAAAPVIGMHCAQPTVVFALGHGVTGLEPHQAALECGAEDAGLGHFGQAPRIVDWRRRENSLGQLGDLAN